MGIRDLTTEDMLHSLGLEHRRTTVDFVFPALGIFGVGLLVGAGLGLLLAPKTGSLRNWPGSRR